MHTYDFTLKFALGASDACRDECIERLYEQGCDDALVGIGLGGRIAMNFAREADSAHVAVLGAVAAVRRAIPDATLIEAAPDFVGLTDVAAIVGCTRQNMRELMRNCSTAVPAPVHEGRPSIWHLAHVLTWLAKQKNYCVRGELVDLAQTNMQLNIAVDLRNSDRSLQREIRSILA